MVAPPWYSIPPQGYGGTELLVYLLARELRNLGHEVAVFGAESPDRGLGIHGLVPDDWGSDLGTADQRFREATYVRRVYKYIQPCDFDLLHDHPETAGPVTASLLRLD